MRRSCLFPEALLHVADTRGVALLAGQAHSNQSICAAGCAPSCFSSDAIRVCIYNVTAPYPLFGSFISIARHFGIRNLDGYCVVLADYSCCGRQNGAFFRMTVEIEFPELYRWRCTLTFPAKIALYFFFLAFGTRPNEL